MRMALQQTIGLRNGNYIPNYAYQSKQATMRLHSSGAASDPLIKWSSSLDRKTQLHDLLPLLASDSLYTNDF